MANSHYKSASTVADIRKPKPRRSLTVVHTVTRLLLILAFCVLSTSLLIDYDNTSMLSSHGTFKQAMTMAELFVVLLAFIGNLSGHSSFYLVFFAIHVQFLCVLAVTTGASLTFYLNMTKPDDQLLNLVVFHFGQLALMILLFITSYFSFRQFKSENGDHEFLNQP